MSDRIYVLRVGFLTEDTRVDTPLSRLDNFEVSSRITTGFCVGVVPVVEIFSKLPIPI